MAFISYAVAELSDPLKIEDSVIAYAELQLGMQRNQRYMQNKERVRLGLQTSPENFFYDETAFAGANYVNLNSLEFTALAGTAEALAYDTAPGTEMWVVVGAPLSTLQTTMDQISAGSAPSVQKMQTKTPSQAENILGTYSQNKAKSLHEAPTSCMWKI